jgi:hypothetical protein
MSAPDLLGVDRELPAEELETLIAATPPIFRPRSVEALATLVNSPDREIRALERDLLIARVKVTR